MKPAKDKFRETLWFKKGEMDVMAADAAADAAAQGAILDLDKADSLPIDDRYHDDGSITDNDSRKYSLKSGMTQMMTAVGTPGMGVVPDSSAKVRRRARVSERELVNEMHSSRKWIFAGVLLAAIGVGCGLYGLGLITLPFTLPF